MSKQVKSTLVKIFAALALAFACVAVAQTFANDSTSQNVQAAKKNKMSKKEKRKSS